jgi:uncharacterized hydrophobic protein (TIGR00271 family)
MVSAGLALAQGNRKLGRAAMKTIVVGFLLTLVISWVVALVTPGREMTPQVLARGDPNLLDLMIALCSAAAGAYAWGRPGVAVGIAGVAIATALIPPLCALGVSIGYRDYLNAKGAAVLFVTNLVAIVLGAAATFRLLGVTFARSDRSQRRWAFRLAAILGVGLVLLAIPLERSLETAIARGKPQPRTYPLPQAVGDALERHIDQALDVEIIAGGQPASQHARSDVVLILTSPHKLPNDYADQLVEIVRREMANPSLVVEVHCLQEAWQESGRDRPQAED